MPYTKYAITGALCITALMQGAASDPEKQKLTFEDCFTKARIPMVGHNRHYATFAVSKRFMVPEDLSSEAKFVDTGVECSGIMCCVGIVEGSDIELTDATAFQAKEIISTAKWIARATEFTGKEAFEKKYLKESLQKVVNGSIELFKRTKDIKLSLSWFQKEKNECHPVEIGKGEARYILIPTFMPPVGIKALERIQICYPQDESFAEKFVRIKKHAATSPITHQATILQTDNNLLAAFCAQECSTEAK